MPTRATLLAGLGLALALRPATADAGTCEGVVVSVDNDVVGSGYSEVHPENFQTHDVDACAGSYRYASKYVGDGSTDGRVMWQPTIAVEGTYRVTTSFRASANRSDDADYLLVGDDGQQQAMIVDQRGDGCVHELLGDIWCTPGGSCRLELDSTDDMKSEAADETVFELVDCDPPPASPCGPLTAAGFEVCAEGPTHCEGVYAAGEGCEAFCAAVGMMCIARFGGEPGCQQEAAEIPCDEVNDHLSDYCVCEGDPPVATTGGSDGGGEGGSTTSGGDPSVDTSVGDATHSGTTATGGSHDASSSGLGSGISTAPWSGADDDGGSSCACSQSASDRGAWGLLVILLARPRRRRWATLAVAMTACAGNPEEAATTGTTTASTTATDPSGATDPSVSSDPTAMSDPSASSDASATDPTTSDATTSGAATSTSWETTTDAGTTSSSSTGTGAESSSSTESSRGNDCNDDNDCDASAPACVYNVCHDGSVDDPCLDDNDCDAGEAPACVYNQCSMGVDGDGCIDDGDCSDAAPHCVFNQCHGGDVDDPCANDGDCDAAPFCVYNACHVGVEDDPCLNDGDCDGTAPHCAQNVCHDGDAGDPCDNAGDCQLACGADLVCT